MITVDCTKVIRQFAIIFLILLAIHIACEIVIDLIYGASFWQWLGIACDIWLTAIVFRVAFPRATNKASKIGAPNV